MKRDLTEIMSPLIMLSVGETDACCAEVQLARHCQTKATNGLEEGGFVSAMDGFDRQF